MLLLQKSLDQLIKDVVTPVLKTEGFKKSGRNYYKKVDHYGLCFNIQSSLYNHSEEVRFTFNTGIFVPAVYELYYDEKAPAFPKEYDCINRKRIGELLGITDLWYSITNSTDEENLKRQLSLDLEKVIIKYFKEFNSDYDLIDIFNNRNFHRSPNDCAFLSGFMVQFGNAEEGKSFFKNYYSKCENEVYKQRLYQFAVKLGMDNI